MDYEQVVDPLNPRQTTSKMIGQEMEIAFGRGDEIPMSWFAMPQWKEPAHLAQAPDAARGGLESHEIDSEVVEGKIALEVYLPRGYDASGDQRYPVAYVHGGSEARERGRIVNSLDNLVGKSVAPMIAVFVAVPAQGPAYANALASEVVPFIDGRYRTVASAGGRANVGASFMAYQSLTLTLSLPDVFGKAGLQSVTMFT